MVSAEFEPFGAFWCTVRYDSAEHKGRHRARSVSINRYLVAAYGDREGVPDTSARDLMLLGLDEY